jgi:hypothetical protein
MNDINWGGRVRANADRVALTFEADVTANGDLEFDGGALASKVIQVSVTFQVYAGYSNGHVAATFTNAWNAKVSNGPFFAVADGSYVRFPGDPVSFNNRKVMVGDVHYPVLSNGTRTNLPNGLNVQVV